MSEIAIKNAGTVRAPWHLWVVGVLSVLWNASGAYTIASAQTGRLPGLEPDEAAYYAAQAQWFMAVTDIALLTAIGGGLALLLRHRWAVPLFGLSIAAIATTAAYDLAMQTSRMLADQGALIVTICIWILAVLQLLYAIAMRKRGVLG